MATLPQEPVSDLTPAQTARSSPEPPLDLERLHLRSTQVPAPDASGECVAVTTSCSAQLPGVGGIADQKAQSQRATTKLSASALQELERTVRSMHPAYAQLRVGRVKTGQRSLLVNVQGAGAHHCLCKGAAHKHSTIYFTVTPNGGCSDMLIEERL